MTSPHNSRALEEFKWLKTHPEFKMRPATIREFVGPGYLDEPKIRGVVLQALENIFGNEVDSDSISKVRKATFTGAIGIGKTTFASICLTYMVHWVKCLKDPQDYFGLAKGTVISFMIMSSSMKLAQEVTFGAVKARINNSAWFKTHSPVINEKQTTQMRFPGDIWIVPGTSEETSFEGHNILAGIIDEGDSHKVTERKDYAEAGYDTINSRIASRYTDFYSGDHRGLIIAIGQMKSKSGFMARKYNEFLTDVKASANKYSIWESYGWHNFTKDKGDIQRGIETSERDSFYFDTRRKELLSKEAAQMILNKDLIEVPKAYEPQFADDPVKAMRDLGGVPPEVDDPFISQTDRILDCQQAWHDRMEVDESPASEHFEISKIKLKPWFRCTDDYMRVIHIDTAYAAHGDALGFAMGHMPNKVMRHQEERPVILFDMLLRLKARSGTQINFGELREFIYMLRDDLGYQIEIVTMDGFNTTEFMQMLRRQRISCDYLSVDKTKGPYEDLRETINDRRCLFPRYLTLENPTDTKPKNIIYRELSELSDAGKKIDHPPLGSKDIADAMAGVVHVLSTAKKYSNAARSADTADTTGTGDAQSLSQFLANNEDGKPAMAVDFETFKKDQERFLSQAEVPGIDYGFLSGPTYSPFGEDKRIF